MPDISITDNINASVDLKLADDAPLVKAKLSHLVAAAQSFLSQFQKPIDDAQICSTSLGFSLSSPSELIADLTTLTIKAGVNGSLHIVKPKDHVLFPDDGFIPVIPIPSDECWIGAQLETSIGAKVSATANGFGIGVAERSAVKAATYTRFTSAGGTFPILKTCLEEALNNYCVLHSPEAIRTQKPGTIFVTEAGGTVKFTGSYTLPVNVSAFASAELPFNYKLNLSPSVVMTVAGEMALSGSFHLRCVRLSADVVQVALYKEKGTELSVGFTAGAGIVAGSGTTDLFAAFLGAVAPSVEPKVAGLTGVQFDPIRDVLKKSIDRSLAISMNTLCSAALTHETAVAYNIQLNGGNAEATDSALAAALTGDWSRLATLPNAVCLRNIATETHDHKYRIAINLLGFYNASSVNDYLKSSKVLVDENGRLFLTDKAVATRIATAAKPYLADSERLRHVLAETNLASITYAAMAGSLEAQLKISQQYFHYDSNMTRQAFEDEILLGDALGVPQVAELRALQNGNDHLGHVRVTATADYNGAAALSVFLADPQHRTSRSKDELERIGRDTLAKLISVNDPQGDVRLKALANDTIWTALGRDGNMNTFSKLPELSGFSSDEVAAIAGDWASVRWWAHAVCELGPKLVEVLNTLDHTPGPDPDANPLLKTKRAALLKALLDVTTKTHAAFNEGWGMAVFYALAQSKPSVSMDFTCSGKTTYFGDAAKRATAGSSGA